MSRKSIVMIGMVVGSYAGGFLPTLFGAETFSLTCVLASLVGGIIGIWLAYRIS